MIQIENQYTISIEISIFLLTVKAQSLKSGADRKGRKSFEKAKASVGTPIKFVLHSLSLFSSWKVAIAYSPAGKFVNS